MPSVTFASPPLRRWIRRCYVRLALLPLLLAGLGLASMVMSITLVTRQGELPALGLVFVTALLALGAGLGALLGWRARLETQAMVDGLTQLEELAGRIGAGQYYQQAPLLPIAELQQTAERVAAMGRQLGDGHQALLEAQRNLSASEARYREAVEGIQEAVFQADVEGHWTFLNTAWERLSGYPIADSLGRPFWDFLHPKDRACIQDMFQSLIQGRATHCHREMRCLRREGGYRWVSVHAHTVTDGQGTAGALIDIHERRQAEEQLRLSAAAVQRSAQGVLITDAQLRITTVNPAFTRITGYQADEIRGNHPSLLTADSAGTTDADPWQPPPSQKDWRGEMSQRHKSGESHGVWLEISVIHDQEGAVSGYVALFTELAPDLGLAADLPARHRRDRVGQSGGDADTFRS